MKRLLLSIFLLSVFVAAAKPSGKERRAEQRKTMVAELGLSYQQSQQYAKLDEERAAKVLKLNMTEMPVQKRNDALKAEKKRFQDSFRAILTADQLTKFNAKIEDEETRRKKAYEIAQNNRTELERQIDAGALTTAALRDATRANDVVQLTMVVGKEKALEIVAVNRVKQRMTHYDVRGLHLTAWQETAFCGLDREREAQLRELGKRQLSSPCNPCWQISI